MKKEEEQPGSLHKPLYVHCHHCKALTAIDGTECEYCGKDYNADIRCSTHCDWPNCTVDGCHQRDLDPNWPNADKKEEDTN